MTYPDCNIYLGRNVVFCGDICSPGDAVVDGNIKGTIEAATVIVGKHAKVNGKISCQTGKFDGIVRGHRLRGGSHDGRSEWSPIRNC